jgi:hypothetical protein
MVTRRQLLVAGLQMLLLLQMHQHLVQTILLRHLLPLMSQRLEIHMRMERQLRRRRLQERLQKRQLILLQRQQLLMMTNQDMIRRLFVNQIL